MYLHIGGETVLQSGEIVGLFDLDGASRGKGTRDFLEVRAKDGRLTEVHGEAMPRTFAVTADDKVYISPVTSETLNKRLENKE
jgi:hypothetical protein